MIIACTGHTEPEYINKAWKHTMDEVMPKPLNVKVVENLLREQMGIEK